MDISFYIIFLISLIFIIALSSTILSLVYESIAYFLKSRGDFLKDAISQVLNDTVHLGQINITELFYAHPQIDLTKRTYRHLPSYISSTNFAQTLIDALCNKYKRDVTRITSTIVTDGDQKKISSTVVQPNLPGDKIKVFSLAVESLGYCDLQILLNGFISNAEGSFDRLNKNIIEWYDEYMNRVSGWYKMKVQKRLFFLGIVLCISMNMDFFHISKTLLTDKVLTEHIAKAAENYPHEKVDSISNPQEFQKAIKKTKDVAATLYELNAPIFWNNVQPDTMKLSDWLFKLAGWLVMAIALSFGSPFWFELLGKLVNIRKSGVKPSTTT